MLTDNILPESKSMERMHDRLIDILKVGSTYFTHTRRRFVDLDSFLCVFLCVLKKHISKIFLIFN